MNKITPFLELSDTSARATGSPVIFFYYFPLCVAYYVI